MTVRWTVRADGDRARSSRETEPCTFHQSFLWKLFTGNGLVAQLVRALACHARGRGFEPHPSRHFDMPL